MTDFEAIYKEQYINVYKYVLSLCHNEYLAEEITQDTFYKALNSLERFDGRCKLYVWLCQIAKNTYFTYTSKQNRFKFETQVFLRDIEQQTDTIFLEKETTQRLQELLNELNSPYKEVFSLRVFYELPFKQIGEIFDKTDSWARLIYYRAKTKLRRDLDEDNL